MTTPRAKYGTGYFSQLKRSSQGEVLRLPLAKAITLYGYIQKLQTCNGWKFTTHADKDNMELVITRLV